MEFPHNARQKGRDEIATLWGKFPESAVHGALQSFHFQLNIKEGSAGEAVQYIFQRGSDGCGCATGLQLLQGMPANGKPVQLRIMANNILMIAGQTEIEFKTVCSLL